MTLRNYLGSMSYIPRAKKDFEAARLGVFATPGSLLTHLNPDSAVKIPNAQSEARACSREGTEPYNFKLFYNQYPVSQFTGTQLIAPQFATFSEAEAHFRQRRISLGLSLKSRRKACASLVTSVQLRNPG